MAGSDDVVNFECPEDGCDWFSGDHSLAYEYDAQVDYEEHWYQVHAPDPPDPVKEYYTLE